LWLTYGTEGESVIFQTGHASTELCAAM